MAVKFSQQSHPTNGGKKRNANTRNRGLSVISSKFDIDGDGNLDKFEKLARSLDVKNQGNITPEVVVDLLREQDALRKRQWLLLFGNIIQWLPIIAGAAFTFLKFSERQYEQNVSGRIMTSMDYIR